MRPLMGTKRIMTARPAKTLGPKIRHKKNIDKKICSGALQIMLMYRIRSAILLTSTDMRLTISPVVVSFLPDTETWRDLR